MRLDIYRRAEGPGIFSYLAVPEQQRIPNEVVNTDWEVEALAVESDEEGDCVPDYAIEHVAAQLAEKSYALTARH
ncbi:MAG: DUF6139 family protein [Pseudomonadota bacterium]